MSHQLDGIYLMFLIMVYDLMVVNFHVYAELFNRKSNELGAK